MNALWIVGYVFAFWAGYVIARREAATRAAKLTWHLIAAGYLAPGPKWLGLIHDPEGVAKAMHARDN